MTPDCARRMQKKLTDTYPTWTKEQGGSVYRAFKSLPDEDYEAAINCHLMDITTGNEPPTPARIRYQLEEYAKSRTRCQQQQEADIRRSTWAAAMPQQGSLAEKYGPQIRAALGVAAEVRRRLVAAYQLDCRCPVDLAVVMGALTDAKIMAESRGELFLSVEDTLPLAAPRETKRQTRMDERRRWFEQWKASCGA